MRTRIAAGVAAASVGLLVVAAVPASASLSKSITPSQLKTLENNLSKNNHATFEAVYQGTSGGKSISFTIAQSPPKSNFTVSTGASQGGEVIDNGKATYFCSSQNGQESCLSEGAGSANPFSELEGLYSSAPVIAALTEAKTGLASRLSGYKVVAGTSTFAGQAATCVTVTIKGNKTGKYCVTKKGVLAYSGTSSSQYFALTKYSSSPPSSLFALPAGATTITLPGGGAIP